MTMKFSNVVDLKKQPVNSGVRGFPVPMAKQIVQGPRRLKVKYPQPTKPGGR
jgi:hypothetical protein